MKSTKKMRLVSACVAAGLTLGLVGTAAAVTRPSSTSKMSPATPYMACASKQGVLKIMTKWTCPSGTVEVKLSPAAKTVVNGATGAEGPQGMQGPQGPAGSQGSAGSNGASVLTSAAVPTDACTTGDSNLDLENGEVYTCTASVWVDTGNSLEGPQGPQGVQGIQGLAGPQGPAGSDGTDGASVLTSAAAPTDACTTGDSDVDLANGEVYTCPASAWVDSGDSIEGPAGTNGTNGVSVTTTQLAIGNSNCPYGGTAVTGANGTSYVCATQPPVEDVTWSPTLDRVDGVAGSTTEIENGSTLEALSATLTGDLSSCTGGWGAAIRTYGLSGYIASWFELSGSDYSTGLGATSDVGTTDSESGTHPLYVVDVCMDSESDPLPWPSGVQITITMQWTHAVPSRTIS